jgi:hypothetical protein
LLGILFDALQDKHFIVLGHGHFIRLAMACSPVRDEFTTLPPSTTLHPLGEGRLSEWRLPDIAVVAGALS